ncbi:hypothetical protein BG015_003343 [Linnemannia schmuckeri]|uniref:TFIIS N-terminal domain-containing protein n=1 Tax=Linnemannia schmuckeri TaxID=64567 RepID=A0A9P5S2I1_9FUNG|nr:hypothetical protein BG015_003343 [Linnemannia schmuckeri]
MSVQAPSPPSSSTSASSSPSSKITTMQMTEAMVAAPTVADIVVPQGPVVAGPGVAAPSATSPVMPSKKRQFMTTVTVPVKRTLRSATTTTSPTPTAITADDNGNNLFSSMQSPGPVSSPVLPESSVAASPPAAVRNWFSRRRTKAKLEEASHADQIMTEDDDIDDADQDSAMDEVSLAPMPPQKREPMMQLTAVVIPVISALSRSTPTATSTVPSIITPVPIPTPAPTSSESVATVQESTVVPASKQSSTNGPPALPEKLTSTEIMKKMARILRGNAIMAPSDVESVIALMGSAEDKVSRKYIINALMHTNAGPVVTEFVSSRGPQIMRGWLMAAKATPNDQENKEIMLRTIAVWAKLPFNYDLLKEFELGKVIKSVSKDKNMDDDVVAKALQLEKHWRRQVMEEMSGATAGDGGANSKSSSLSSGPKSEGLSNKRSFQGNGPDGDRARVKRDRDDSTFSQSSEMKLPKFNKGKPATAPATAPATETKKTHIVANAGFFKELMAPASTSSKPPSSTTKALTSSLSVTTDGSSKLPAKPHAVDSTASPLKPASSPPTTPTTPTTPITPTTPTTAVFTSGQRLSPVAAEPGPVLEPVPESTSAPVAAPVVAPTSAALQAIAAAVASLTGSSPIPIEAEIPAVETPAEPVKLSKPKKVVRFKAADELEMIRYFVPYSDAEEKETLLSGELWRPPPMLVLSSAERGSASVEKTVQEKREAETLSVNYIREAYIPISPAEPDPDPMDTTTAAASSAVAAMVSAVPVALPPVEATTDHSAILMNSLAFLTQMASSSSGSTSAAATPAISQPVADQSQVESFGTYGTVGVATYGTGSTTGYGAGVAGTGYGADASGYGTGGSGYGSGAAGYGTGAASYGTVVVGSYGTYGTVPSYGAGVGIAQTQQPQQQQTYQYSGYQQSQQASQAAYNPSVMSQAYDYQQHYQQAITTATAATPAPVATAAGGATSNMDPLALIEMLKQVTGHQQQQQQQGQYGFPQNWPNSS